MTMSRTFFQDFTRDNGLPITVEYAVEGSYSPTTYSPHSGADGGDHPEFSIIKVWPNTPFHNRLARGALRLSIGNERTALGWKLAAALRHLIELLMRADEWLRASITDAERERMEGWIADHWVDEPDDYEPGY